MYHQLCSRFVSLQLARHVTNKLFERRRKPIGKQASDFKLVRQSQVDDDAQDL